LPRAREKQRKRTRRSFTHEPNAKADHRLARGGGGRGEAEARSEERTRTSETEYEVDA
jgi:hypothetical protein